MRIENLNTGIKGNSVQARATVIWEDSESPTQEIYFQTDEQFGPYLSCNPNAFLLATLLPAMRLAEKRVAIDAEVCPELQDGLLTAMSLIREWFGPDRSFVRIESKPRFRPPSSFKLERACSFLSGGIDSLATLRANRLNIPPNHPASIKDCLFVQGFDIPLNETSDTAFRHILDSLSEVAKDADVTLIPIATNIASLYDDMKFWMYEFHGAAIAAVAHSLSRRLTRAYVASSCDVRNVIPWGSNPLLDPNYSSADLRIYYDSLRLSRLAKTEIVGDWDIALQNLRVCVDNQEGLSKCLPNCGQCEKCIRTMVELVAVGKLSQTQAFPVNDVSPEMLEKVYIRGPGHAAIYRDMLEPLGAQGRHDLVQVIEIKLAEYEKLQAWKEERDWRGVIRRFDRNYLGSNVIRFRNLLRRQSDVVS
jgi:hypothetical protein